MNAIEIVNVVREIANGDTLSADISKILFSHNCFYLLSKIMEKNKYTDLGRATTVANSIVIKDRFNGCKDVFSDLQNIPYAVIKGAVLSQSAYKSISYRRSNDIDLLISRTNVDNIKRIFLQNGFIQGRIENNEIVPFTRQELLYHSALSHQTAPFIKKIQSSFCPFVNIDVNMDIMWGESKHQTDMENFLSHTIETEVCGVAVKKLDPIAEFISLCLHHYKDMNSIYLLSMGSLKLSLFCDIYFYLMNNEFDVTELKQTCDAFNVTEYVYYCIYNANLIFDDEILFPYISELESESANAILNSYGLDYGERKEWNIDLFYRLFDGEFTDRFVKRLESKELEKIEINKKFMI